MSHFLKNSLFLLNNELLTNISLQIDRSYFHWTNTHLAPSTSISSEIANSLFFAPFVLLAHGTEADPILKYGNQQALQLWEMNWEEFIKTPSRKTAEVMEQSQRQRFLEEVNKKGCIANYEGIRISNSGKQFRIFNTQVWNLVDENGVYSGQAACFDRWEYLI